eukprot:364568-Chlamydomonas_euryale.AAC.6
MGQRAAGQGLRQRACLRKASTGAGGEGFGRRSSEGVHAEEGGKGPRESGRRTSLLALCTDR